MRKKVKLKETKIKTTWRKDFKRNKSIYLMIAPVLLGFIIFKYLPLYGIVIAFKNYDIIMGFWDSPWVGLKYFRSFLTDPYAFRVVKNTLIIGVYSVLLFWPSILLALLLNELRSKRLKKTIQSISYLPHFISTVVIVGMLMELLNPTGVVNNLIVALGGNRIAFFNKPDYFRTIYLVSGVWQGVGFSSILYLAALSGIDPQLYEAAEIDGASRFGRVIHVSLPGITPLITILLILSVANILSHAGFEKVLLMQNPAIYKTADVISTYVYRRGIINRNFSYATTVGLLNSVVAFVLLYSSNKFSRRMGETSLW
ncbi:MAG: sugar ABC transporter permease [Spirochaetales bacterium]|nr:sugar ABC transporter permease [Spirochaetales bacterium]